MRLTSAVLLLLCAAALSVPAALFSDGPAEAPAGFDNLTNGFVTQTEFDSAREAFESREGIDEGLGPVYNAEACVECHQNPVPGAVSQVTELRAGHFNGSVFVDHPGGSLINDRAIHPDIQERVLPGNEVRAMRASLNTLGDGFVEAIDSNDLVDIAQGQPSSMRGQFIQVPVLESPGAVRGGRFGWKNQNSSLVSFSADAYLNEMGISTPLLPTENTSNGRSVALFDPPPNPDEPDNDDVEAFATFMRATKVPPRDTALAATSDAVAGAAIFDNIGCDTCHVRRIVTAPPGTLINGGAFRVPAALGNKVIRPFGDFLLHDVGTGDGIVQNGGQSTRNKVRTVPLWGLRTHSRFMHDGQSLTFTDAILRHGGEASSVVSRFVNQLTATQRNQVLVFLRSL